jgi:hypothetical protein
LALAGAVKMADLTGRRGRRWDYKIYDKIFGAMQPYRILNRIVYEGSDDIE